MATIRSKPRADGSIAYRAEIRIKRKGNVVHRESATFSKKRDAQQWAKKREVSLGAPGALDELLSGENLTIAQLIERYVERVKKLNGWERSKEYELNAWLKRDLAKLPAKDLTPRHLIAFASEQVESGIKPTTVATHLSYLRTVYSVAEQMLDVPLTLDPFLRAQSTLSQLQLVRKSEERDRRPTVQEMSTLVEYAYHARRNVHNRARACVPLDKILVFAMFSARRQSEITRLRWEDLDRGAKRILVRDAKDPRKKKGNHITVSIPDQAFAVIESMPEDGEFIFPYEGKTIGTRFYKYRADTGLKNVENPDESLRFHDLRHECLSWLAEKNGLPGEHWDTFRLQRVSGHKNVQMLQRYVNIASDTPTDKWKDWEWATKVLE